MREITKEELGGMTVAQRLSEARVRFLESGAKKSGVNQHAEFMYFELADIVPTATRIFDDLDLLFMISFDGEMARGTLYTAENFEDEDNSFITVSFPMRSIAEPAKFRMNEVQGLGAEITYMRRYLYMLILDIVEADTFDAESGRTEDAESGRTEDAPKPAKTAKKAAKKPATKEERAEIKEEITDADGPAEELQVENLRLALAKLLNTDPEQEEFVQAVAVETEGFTKVTKSQAEKLIGGISEMLEQYETEEK